jgi:hypothetical protein
MNSKKVFFVMIGIVVLMSGLVVGAVVVGDTVLRKQSEKLVALKLDTDVVETQQTALVQAKKDVEKYAELESIAKQVVPQDKDQARAVREIISIADQAGVKISSITFPSSNLGQKPAATAPASGTSTTTPTAATAAPVNPFTQAKPVSGIGGLYQLDITVVSDTTKPATYTRLIDFLGRLEHNRRTAQVSQISIQPHADNRDNLNFTLTLTVYIKP